MSITIEISEVWLDGSAVVKTVEVDGTLQEAIKAGAAEAEGLGRQGQFVAVVHAGEDIQAIVYANGLHSIYSSAGIDFAKEREEAVKVLVDSDMTFEQAFGVVDGWIVKEGGGQLVEAARGVASFRGGTVIIGKVRLGGLVHGKDYV